MEIHHVFVTTKSAMIMMTAPPILVMQNLENACTLLLILIIAKNANLMQIANLGEYLTNLQLYAEKHTATKNHNADPVHLKTNLNARLFSNASIVIHSIYVIKQLVLQEKMEFQVVFTLKSIVMMVTNALKITVIQKLEVAYTTKLLPKIVKHAKLPPIAHNGDCLKILLHIAKNLTVTMTTAELELQQINLNANHQFAKIANPILVKQLNVCSEQTALHHAFAHKKLATMETNVLLINATLQLEIAFILSIKQANANLAQLLLIAPNMELIINLMQTAKFQFALLKESVILKLLKIHLNALKQNAQKILIAMLGQLKTTLLTNASLLIAIQENASLEQLMI
jgi:hypothetical protein